MFVVAGRSSTPQESVEPSAAPHPKSYMEVKYLLPPWIWITWTIHGILINVASSMLICHMHLLSNMKLGYSLFEKTSNSPLKQAVSPYGYMNCRNNQRRHYGIGITSACWFLYLECDIVSSYISWTNWDHNLLLRILMFVHLKIAIIRQHPRD